MKKVSLVLLCSFFCLLVLNAQENTKACCEEWSFEEETLTLEDALLNPEKVTKLDMSLQTPKLTKVPDQVTKLVNLECLIVSYNRVATFPEDFAKLQKLCMLDLTANHYLQTLPDCLNEMPNLKVIKIKDLKWSKEKRDATEKKFPHITFVW